MRGRRHRNGSTGGGAGERAGSGRGAAAVRLSAILPDATFIGCDDIEGFQFTDRADRCRPGDVFVARQTAAHDGHEDVAEAVAGGARGVVAERMVAAGGTPICLVPDSGRAFGRLAQASAGDPSRRLRVIAVTGTSGKTTTAWLTAAALAEAGARVGVLSDLGCLGHDDPLPQDDDYASAPTLAGWLARLLEGGCTHAVVEASSLMLADHVLAGVQCDTVVVTNLGSAHLDAHGTREAYHALKARSLETLGPDGWLVTGVGPRKLDRLRRLLPDPAHCLTAGLTAACDVHADCVERSLFGRTVLARHGGQIVPLALATPVVPFARDALLAAAVAVRYGVPLEVAARGIEAAGSVPGRVERIDRGQDAAVFIDAPSSGHALAATLASLRRLTPGRLVVVAEEPLVARLGRRRFAGLVAMACDEWSVAPTDLLADEAGPRTVTAYARIDRLLGSLGEQDCLLALGGIGAAGDPPPPAGRFPLAAVIEGWLTLDGRDSSGTGRLAA